MVFFRTKHPLLMWPHIHAHIVFFILKGIIPAFSVLCLYVYPCVGLYTQVQVLVPSDHLALQFQEVVSYLLWALGTKFRPSAKQVLLTSESLFQPLCIDSLCS